jgi:NADH-quinone oxidoreductase subunit L
MLIPLYCLAAGAVLAGWLGYDYFVGGAREVFWRESLLVLEANDTLEAIHHVPAWVPWLPLVVSVSGIALAYVMYILMPELPGRLVAKIRPLYLFVHNKWYFDELYDAIFVRPAHLIGRGLWKSGDGTVIDGVGPDGIAAATLNMARRAAALQSGYVYHYAFAMLIGVVVLATWYILGLLG